MLKKVVNQKKTKPTILISDETKSGLVFRSLTNQNAQGGKVVNGLLAQTWLYQAIPSTIAYFYQLLCQFSKLLQLWKQLVFLYHLIDTP